MSQSVSAPPMKRGWMRKQARSGLIKNWQTRYFVLYNGKISYYQDQIDRFPYGDYIKGEMALNDATIVNDPKRFTDKQIFVSAAKGEKDMLVECESASDAQEWMRALTQHIAFASSGATGGAVESKTTLVERYNSTTSASDRLSRNNTANFEDNTPVTRVSLSSSPLSPSSSAQSTHIITPHPILVIKAIRTNGEKVFINLTEHSDIPASALTYTMGYNKWPLMVLTPARSFSDAKDKSKGENDGNIADKEASEVTVYDAVVNPQVTQIIVKEAQSKDAACQRVLRLLKKMYGEDLVPEYKLPKINKKYKGELWPIKLPSDLSALHKSKTPVHVSFVKPTAQTLPRSLSLTPSAHNSPVPQSSSQLVNTPSAVPPMSRSVSLQNPEPLARSPASILFGSVGGAADTPERKVDFSASSTPNGSISQPNSALKRAASVRADVSNTQNSLSPAHNTGFRSLTTTGVPLLQPSPPPLPRSPPSQNPTGKKLVVPYTVLRPSGLVAKVRPDKSSSTSKVLAGHSRVFAVARRIAADSQPWIKTTEGWVQESVGLNSSQRTLTPSLNGQPLSLRVVRTRFEDGDDHGNLRASYPGRQTFRASQSGWMGFRSSAIQVDFVTVFLLEVTFAENAFLRISRSLNEVFALRDALLQSNDRLVRDRTARAPFLSFTRDGDLTLFEDVQLLVALVEEIEEFLRFLLNAIQLERVKDSSLRDFLTPREEDWLLMDVELSAKRGVGGGWDVEEPTPIEY